MKSKEVTYGEISIPISTSHPKTSIVYLTRFLRNAVLLILKTAGAKQSPKDEILTYYYREENSRFIGYIDGYPEYWTIAKNQAKLEENLERVYDQIKRGVLNKESNAEALEAWEMSRHALLDVWDNPKDSTYDKL